MANEKTDNELLRDISDRLNEIVGLLAIQGKPQDDQTDILRSLGLEWNKIGMFLGMSATAVRLRNVRRKK